MDPDWWHWMVLGVLLVLLELAIPAFFVIWFGLGAMVVGLVLAAMPGLSLAAQVILWIVASVVFVIAWMKVFKASVHRTRVGLSKGQFAGEVGMVTRDIAPFQKGQIRFQKPILGADTWEAIADESIAPGERVHVLEVEGNILRVRRAHK
ncbi:MAG: NfeD family protein [Burkholderiales bacterium]|nr:NfeD family protein [Burkholderiales bacterium]